MDGVPNATCLIWEHVIESNGKPCSNPRVIIPRGMIENIVPGNKPQEVNVRSFGERVALNTPIQGTAADIIKLAMVHVWQRLRDEKLQARLLLQVHDELIVEAPDAEIDEVKRILKEEMENVVHYSVPLTTEVGTGKTWLAAH